MNIIAYIIPLVLNIIYFRRHIVISNRLRTIFENVFLTTPFLRFYDNLTQPVILLLYAPSRQRIFIGIHKTIVIYIIHNNGVILKSLFKFRSVPSGNANLHFTCQIPYGLRAKNSIKYNPAIFLLPFLHHRKNQIPFAFDIGNEGKAPQTIRFEKTE